MKEKIQLHDGRSLMVHARGDCIGKNCVIHNPSQHGMRSFPLNWRGDRRLMERICPHGIGHPDPDDLAYKKMTDEAYSRTEGVHGCDGCCTQKDVPGEDPVLKVLRAAHLKTLTEEFWKTDGLADQIFAEMGRAAEKHGLHKTPFSADLYKSEKLVVLAEEFGEVARAITYDEGDEDALLKELIQVCAMAGMWAMREAMR